MCDNKETWTEASIEVAGGNIGYVINLLKNGFFVDTVLGPNEFTLIATAVTHNQKEIVQLLLDNNADVNIKNKFGLTPLLTAAKRGFVDIAKLLLAHNANFNIKSNQGFTAMSLAAYLFHDDIVALLLEHNDSKYSAEEEWKYYHPSRRNEPFKGSNIHFVNAMGWTYLNMLCTIGLDEDTLTWFLENKANINFENNDWTPLCTAIRFGEVSTVQLLLQKGADIHYTTTHGYNAYKTADRHCPKMRNILDEFISSSNQN